jgi:hypothetical protein
MRAALAGLLAVVLLAAVVLGGWQVGWWFKSQNINREAKITRHSFGYQQTYREQVTRGIGDVLAISSQIASAPDSQVVSLKAQRAAILAQTCSQAAQIVGDYTPDQEAFISTNCTAGVPNPDSEFSR